MLRMANFTIFELNSTLTDIISDEYYESVSIPGIVKEIKVYEKAKGRYERDKESVSQRIESRTRRLQQVCTSSHKVKKDCACRSCEGMKSYHAQKREHESEIEEKISALQRILNGLQGYLEVKASDKNEDPAYGDQFLNF